jgi:hypothetical protein
VVVCDVLGVVFLYVFACADVCNSHTHRGESHRSHTSHLTPYAYRAGHHKEEVGQVPRWRLAESEKSHRSLYLTVICVTQPRTHTHRHAARAGGETRVSLLISPAEIPTFHLSTPYLNFKTHES